MVRIDKVYQKVLALANKEQRGYITPQEFNLFADHAQLEIFEQYFYDSNQFKRTPGNDSEYHDMVSLIDEKLAKFKKDENVFNGYGISEFYNLGNVYLRQGGFMANDPNPYDKSFVVEEITQEDLVGSQNSPLTRATNERPIYYIEQGKMYFFPQVPPNNGQYRAYFIEKPKQPNWAYNIVSGNAIFNGSLGSGLQDFELHASEENSLVTKILQLAGLAIKDFNLAQLAGQKEASVTQQEKQ